MKKYFFTFAFVLLTAFSFPVISRADTVLDNRIVAIEELKTRLNEILNELIAQLQMELSKQNLQIEEAQTTNVVSQVAPAYATSEYALGDKTCEINKTLYGTSKSHAFYPIVPNLGFNRAVLNATITRADGTGYSKKEETTVYTKKQGDLSYNKDLAEAVPGIRYVESGNSVDYIFTLYNDNEVVGDISGNFIFGSCQ